MKNKLKPSIVLSLICLTVALLLAAVNALTLPLIKKAQAEKVQQTLSSVMPEGMNFKEIELAASLPDEITNVFTEDGGGYVFQMKVTGYKPGLIIMCGISKDGIITGADYVESKETMSAEVGLGEKFIGANKDSMNIDIVAGPTAKKTTHAYYRAIEAAMEGFEILNTYELLNEEAENQ